MAPAPLWSIPLSSRLSLGAASMMVSLPSGAHMGRLGSPPCGAVLGLWDWGLAACRQHVSHPGGGYDAAPSCSEVVLHDPLSASCQAWWAHLTGNGAGSPCRDTRRGSGSSGLWVLSSF